MNWLLGYASFQDFDIPMYVFTPEKHQALQTEIFA